jgi:hypothetical protein
VADTDISFFGRLSLAIVCAFRIVFDAAFAARVQRAASGDTAAPALPAPRVAGAPAPPIGVAPAPERAPAGAARAEPVSADGALAVLALFQREGRLVDFLQESVEGFPDADVGAAARVVHAGCRRALQAHFDIVRVRDEAEGSPVTLTEGFDAASVKLTGDVRGNAPYRGVLRHAGWRVRQVTLPDRVAGHDTSILAPAEVEL